MYVLVAGGGHMGSFLATRLLAAGHETLVIDTDPRVTERLYAEHGVVTVTGSATDLSVLEQAGLKRADAAVAMTGRDADNLAFCLLARYYGVPRVLARMLDPQYEVPYKLVGATKIHSETDLIVSSFLTSLEFPEIGALMSIGPRDLVAFEVRVSPLARVAGRTVQDIVRDEAFPSGCLFIGVESSEGDVKVPTGATVIAGGASVILAAHRPDLPGLLRCLTAPRPEALAPEAGEALSLLARVSFLAGVSRDDLEPLAAVARFTPFAAGQAVYAQGEPGDALYVVQTGACEVSGRAGSAVLRSPAFFGERTAFTGQARTRNARMVEDGVLLAVPGADVRALALRNPFLALEFAKLLSAGA
ncbi:MAG: NAD-binding protein [Vicinamibacteria bacterium]|nr:NAD-binding protein [Vicinamibacteria bacterium]